MKIPSKELIEYLKNTYPEKSRVELVKMDDPQAPPTGTLGTVICVDDIGTIHVRWDTGCGLGVAFGEDECRRIG